MFFARDAALAALPELGPRTRGALEALLPGPGDAPAAEPAPALPAACGPDPRDARAARARVAGALAALAGVPVLQSSANLAGGPDARALADVPPPIRDGADLVLDGGELPGTPSTVVDLRAWWRAAPGRSCARAPCPRTRSRAASGSVRRVQHAAFVTGGSGFIGGALIRRLVAEGWRVRGAGAQRRLGARRRRARRRGRARRPRRRRGDVARACAAARSASTAPRCSASGATARRSSTATSRARRTCSRPRAAPACARFVHVGTEAALLAGEPLVMVDETAPLRPDSPALYSSTKAKAEQAVIAAAGDELETVVVRPRLVWGPGDTTILPRSSTSCAAGASPGSAAGGT